MQFIIPIIVIILIVMLMSRSKKKKKSDPVRIRGSMVGGSTSEAVPVAGRDTDAKDSHAEPLADPESSSSIRYSRNFKKEEKQHVTMQVLKYVPQAGIWTCPNCETENPVAESVCCVCHKGR